MNSYFELSLQICTLFCGYHSTGSSSIYPSETQYYHLWLKAMTDGHWLMDVLIHLRFLKFIECTTRNFQSRSMSLVHPSALLHHRQYILRTIITDQLECTYSPPAIMNHFNKFFLFTSTIEGIGFVKRYKIYERA